MVSHPSVWDCWEMRSMRDENSGPVGINLGEESFTGPFKHANSPQSSFITETALIKSRRILTVPLAMVSYTGSRSLWTSLYVNMPICRGGLRK